MDIRDNKRGAINIRRCGHVYVLESGCGGFVKIGRSKQPEKRLAGLRTSLNSAGRSWVSCLQADSHDCEKRAHSCFQSSRRLGEWFQVPFLKAVDVISRYIIDQAPSDSDVEAARDVERQRKQQAHKELMHSMGLSNPSHADISIEDCRLAAAIFVFDQEAKTVASDFSRNEADFLADFDCLPHAAAELVKPLILRNTRLIGKGLAYQERKELVVKYAADYRARSIKKIT